MFNHLLVKLLLMSLSGSLIACLLFAIRPLIQSRLSQTWQYYIWLAVTIRLLIPFTPRLSLMGSLYTLWAEIRPAAVSVVPAPGAVPYGILEYAGVIWLTVTAALMLKKIISYRLFIKWIRSVQKNITEIRIRNLLQEAVQEAGVTRKITLCSCPLPVSPMLIGWLRPCIVLPETILSSTEDLKYIFLHELIHHKRRDFLYKWLIQFLSCLYFFNPLLWYMRKVISKNCELSCDERVIRRLNPQDSHAYGWALIHMLERNCTHQKPGTVSMMLCEETIHMKERLSAIKRYQKSSRTTAALSCFLTAAIGCFVIYIGLFKDISAAAYCQCAENIARLIL